MQFLLNLKHKQYEYQNTGDGILFVKAKYNYLYILFNVVCKHNP